MKNSEIPLLPDRVYHIYTHANGKENLFANRENYLYFLKRYTYFIEPIAETFAYCLMPNHVHFMVRIKADSALQDAHNLFLLAKTPAKKVILISEKGFSQFLSKTFGNLFSSYTLAFNRHQARMGSLFIPNFKRKQIDSEEYYTRLIRYIHRNPVHHGFASAIDKWEFSSYQSILSNKPTRLCRADVLDWFGNRQLFVQFHQQQEPDE